ncbi:MAG: hypothetical protein VX938_09595, partial [Myxococcota bacterium]|nr:hypothetical protein [Myxococcota bacterium]
MKSELIAHHIAVLLLITAMAFGAGCVESSGRTVLPPLRVTGVGPLPLLPGTGLTVTGDGFVPSEVAGLSMRLQATIKGQNVDLAIAPRRIDDQTLQVDISGALRELLIHDGENLRGQLTVTRVPLATGGAESVVHGIDLPTAETLAPTLLTWQPTLMYVGDDVTLTGAGALHPTEGVTVLRFDGVYSTEAPHEDVVIDGVEILAFPDDPLSREQWNLQLNTQPFGLRPGVFEGTITARNELISGLVSVGAPFTPGPLVVSRSIVEGLSPPQASRGQRVVVTGEGLVEPDA